ncbi:hypothetical protein BN2476_100076 [Paraburkholderia piptadeniae]|uniref:Uncharacterized protein n=1 Tax=Paraburkholderia piptadeniae TaxID=1701573 RepID=A0A1N7RNT1_9BURK|nr:hypothetical protein BN2476_100076 [Paraburkholderia piptadeniae]
MSLPNAMLVDEFTARFAFHLLRPGEWRHIDCYAFAQPISLCKTGYAGDAESLAVERQLKGGRHGTRRIHRHAEARRLR